MGQAVNDMPGLGDSAHGTGGAGQQPADAPVERRRCEECGQPARVHILEEYADGDPIWRHLCPPCANQAYELYLESGSSRRQAHLAAPTLLVVAGLLVVVLGVCVDQWGVQGAAGFGWKQQLGLATGGLMVIIGALLHVDVLAIGGSILLGLVMIVDIVGRMGAPGVGWRQQAVILLGLLAVAMGVRLRTQRNSRARSAGAIKGGEPHSSATI